MTALTERQEKAILFTMVAAFGATLLITGSLLWAGASTIACGYLMMMVGAARVSERYSTLHDIPGTESAKKERGSLWFDAPSLIMLVYLILFVVVAYIFSPASMVGYLMVVGVATTMAVVFAGMVYIATGW